jgi:hypothetical protein
MPRRSGSLDPRFSAPQGARQNQRDSLEKEAAANPLRPGTPAFYKALNNQQRAATGRVKNYSTRALKILNVGNTNTGVGIGRLAINSSIQGTAYRRALSKRRKTITAYEPPEPPAPYTLPPSTSLYTSIPALTVDSDTPAADKPPMHPTQVTHMPHLYAPPNNSRSALARVCNGVTCGLYSKFFGSRRNRRGGRRTIRRRKVST